MTTDYCSWTLAADAAQPPAEPCTAKELSALYDRAIASPDEFICLFSDNDNTLGCLREIARFIDEPAFEFLQQRFVVLDEAQMRRTADAIARLLARARSTPCDLIAPFEETLTDGRRYQPFDIGQVADALDSAVTKYGNDAINAVETHFLWGMFTYLNSLQRLLSAALRDGRSVVFLRYNELSESFPSS